MNITFTQASGLQDSIYGNYQHPIQRFVERRGEELEQTTLLKDLFLTSKTQNYGDTMTAMTAMSGFEPVGELGAHPLDGMQESFRKHLPQEVWKNSFQISREMVDDARIIDMKKQPDGFLISYLRTREQFGAALYGGAIKGQGQIQFKKKVFDGTSADGLTLFHKQHPAKVSKKTQSNMFADAFSADALGRMEERMQKFRGDTDELLDVAPDTIIIPNDADLKKEVFAAIGADKDPVTANNAFNYQYGRWSVIVWTYLDDYIAEGTKPWILIDDKYNKLYGGAVWNDRIELEINSTVDSNTNANVWWGYSRFNATFNDWRFAAIGGMPGGDQLKRA